MVPTIDAPNESDLSLGEPYSFILGLKEMTLLSIILFIGFSGFTFCINKIYADPIYVEESKEIKVYEAEPSQAYISINAVELTH